MNKKNNKAVGVQVNPKAAELFKEWARDKLEMFRMHNALILRLSLGFALVFGVVSFIFFPDVLNWMVYQKLYRDFAKLVLVLFSVVVLGQGFQRRVRNKALFYVSIVGAYVLYARGDEFIQSLILWQTQKHYSFRAEPQSLAVNTDAVRFAPMMVAHTDMIQTLGSSEATVREHYVHAVDWGNRLGYAGPITPDGLWMHLTYKNDGFIVYNDGAEVSDRDRVQRVAQRQQVGLDMEVFDNIHRILYQADLFAYFPEVYYLPLGGTNDKLTAVAPKIKYRWKLPYIFVPVPEWSGVVLVHSDGKYEDLSPDQARSDPRLKGRQIFPESLAIALVEAQRFDKGFVSGWIRREGKIKIPKMRGMGKLPFLMKAESGRSFYVVPTEPDGESFALFRLYYVDVFSGERSYFEFKPELGVLGPEKAAERIKSLKGFKWIEDDGGDFRIIDPVYIVRKGESKLYWKYTITTKSYTGIVGTAVVEAHSKELITFLDENKDLQRLKFQRWLTGAEEPSSAPQSNPKGQVLEIKRRLLEALSELEKVTPQ